MQMKHLAVLSCGLLPLLSSLVTGSEQLPAEFEHPAEVALQQLEEGEFRYVHTATNLRLYVYEKDSPGKSNCTGGCASVWPPLLAKDDARPVGAWTLIDRDSGSRQWAYKGQPVYLRFHDSASDPQGYQPSEGWLFLEP